MTLTPVAQRFSQLLFRTSRAHKGKLDPKGLPVRLAPEVTKVRLARRVPLVFRVVMERSEPRVPMVLGVVPER